MAGKPTEERGGGRDTTETLADPGKGPRPVVIASRAAPGPEELSEMAEGLGLTERFEVVGPLGRGGMGVVLEARDRRLGRDVAIKVLSGARMYDGVARARFEREARAAARLSDPSIVTVHELAASGDYMVMELVRGESLKERLERGALPAGEVRRLGAALCRALSVAHAAGVIHRDVKPSNVLIDGAERIRLADFGIATFTDAELTVTGVMIGTPAYMAPEQLRGGAVDARSDLYAVGATLFEAATGRMLNDPADPCRDPADAVSAATGDRALAAAIARAAAERPDDRFGAAEELAAALAEAGGRPRRRWAVAAAGAAALALATGAWLAWPRAGGGATGSSRFVDQALVVLPFENRSLDRSLTFAADGLADNLQRELGGQEAFELVARARLARELPDGVTGENALAAARRAGASWAVRGSIGDQAGGLVMVTIDLVDTGAGHHVVNVVSKAVPAGGLVAEVRAAAEPIAALMAGAGGGTGSKERQMELGRRALVEDRIPEAVRHYSTVLLGDPADGDALTARAFAAWWNAGTPEPTLAAIDAALAAPLEPRHREFLAAFRLLVDVRYPDAILAFERLAAARPREFEVLYGLFEAQFHGGRPVDAAATFDRLRHLEPRIVVGLMHPLHRAVVRPDTPGLEWARAEMGNGVRNRGSLVRWLLAERDYRGAEQVLAQVEKGMVGRAADFDIAEIQLALATERYQAVEAPLARLAGSRPIAHLSGRIGLAWAQGDQVALARWTSHEALAVLGGPGDSGDLAELATLAAALPLPELRSRVAAALDQAAGWQRRTLSHHVARVLLLAAADAEDAASTTAISPYPEVEAVGNALRAEAAGDPRAAAAAWRAAADSTLEGRFLVVEEAGVARNLAAAGDRRAAAEACDRVIEPRAFQWAWAAEVGPCLERRAAAGDRVAARRLGALRGR